MNILITGARGQLGKEVSDIYNNDSENTLFQTDLSELDITIQGEVDKYIIDNNIGLIINCAAYTNVDGCETNEEEAYKVNAIGPMNLARSAEKHNAEIVHISTDYVFSGNEFKNRIESDITNPISAYGRTKLAGEELVIKNTSRYYILRTAWLYGDGKNFLRTMLDLSRIMNEVRVVSDQFGTPTSTVELAKMLKRIALSKKYGIYHTTCEGKCSWADFAESIFEEYKLDTKVKRITSEEYNSPTKRPKYSVLENKNLKDKMGYVAAEWREALKEYVKNNPIKIQ